MDSGLEMEKHKLLYKLKTHIVSVVHKYLNERIHFSQLIHCFVFVSNCKNGIFMKAEKKFCEYLLQFSLSKLSGEF